jgi:helix-turn-helix protein
MAEIEPFVDAERGAEFLGIMRRRLLEMARGGTIPAHAIGNGNRKTWRFRLSELAEAIAANKPRPFSPKRGIIGTGSSRQPNRRK